MADKNDIRTKIVGKLVEKGVTGTAGGIRQAECRLPAPPVLDGMALADSGVFVSLIDGSVVCLGRAE